MNNCANWAVDSDALDQSACVTAVKMFKRLPVATFKHGSPFHRLLWRWIECHHRLCCLLYAWEQSTKLQIHHGQSFQVSSRVLLLTVYFSSDVVYSGQDPFKTDKREQWFSFSVTSMFHVRRKISSRRFSNMLCGFSTNRELLGPLFLAPKILSRYHWCHPSVTHTSWRVKLKHFDCHLMNVSSKQNKKKSNYTSNTAQAPNESSAVQTLAP